MGEELSAVVEGNLEGMSEVLIETIRTVTEVRDLMKTGSETDDPVTIHEHLIYNRSQIERLEHMTSQLLLLKSRIARKKAVAQNAYDDAYMKAATSPSVGFDDYTSAKEKDAKYNSKTVKETMDLRKVEAVFTDVTAAYDYARMLLRGAEGTHRDLELRMRLISLTGQLDR